jgi:hypothetical protein
MTALNEFQTTSRANEKIKIIRKDSTGKTFTNQRAKLTLFDYHIFEPLLQKVCQWCESNKGSERELVNSKTSLHNNCSRFSNY